MTIKQLLILTLFLSWWSRTNVVGQDILTLEEAINVGLEHNYNIRIARNNEQIASNNNNPGNAGFLPRATANGNVTYTSNNTKQRFFSGDEQSGQSAGTTNIRLGVALTWTAFDGFRMYATRDRLRLEEERSRAFTQSAMHDLVASIEQAYYAIVRNVQQIGIINQSIQLNTAIQELAKAKLKIGTGTNLEVLQTTNRVNADSSTLLNLQDQLGQANIVLNRLLGRTPNTAFEVPAEIPIEVLPNQEELTRLAIAQNHTLNLLSYDERIALTQIKEARAAFFPTIDITAGYNYNFVRAEVGFLLSNRSFGPTIGLQMNYDLFPGRNLKKDIQNVEIFQKNIQLSTEDTKEAIEAEIATLFHGYKALQELVVIETKNLGTAEQNTDLSRRLYQSGRATNFDVREAILAETQVKDRLSEIQFRLKLTEIQLKQIAGIPYR